MKKTKIICTIGPKTASKEMLILLLNSGMDIMRLNFSHGDHNEHVLRINNLRDILKKTNNKAAIILDTKGPEIRTMTLKNNNVFLKTDQIFTLSTDQSIIGNDKIVAITYSDIINDIKIGNIILIDDGIISMQVIKIQNCNVICKVLNSGLLGSNKGINIPGIKINMPALNKQDKLDLIFACEQKLDFIAASFIRNKEDVSKIRKYLNKNNGKFIKIISKIENQEGLNNFDEILNVSDGIMVARGDLGVEIPIENVILEQKKIIKKCNEACKLVITATQMLDSMINNPRPTRAEAGDIANAIFDGTDAVMLSGETAKGKYPIKSLNIMRKICEKTDFIVKNRISSSFYKNKKSNFEIICKNIVEISENLNAAIIIVKTKTGKSARIIRKYFPHAIILALTSNEYTAKQLILSKGIISQFIKDTKKDNTFDVFYNTAISIIIKNKIAKVGELLIFLYIMKNPTILKNGKVKNCSIHIMNL